MGGLSIGKYALLAGIISFATGNDSNFRLPSSTFPARNERPVLSNGNLGFEVFGDSVFLNGVYNGLRSQSKRARIPNYANYQFEHCANPQLNPPNCAYQLDMQYGRFRTVYNDPGRRFRVTHDVYAHRYFTHSIVNRFRLEKLTADQNELSIQIQLNQGAGSEDINFRDPERFTNRQDLFWVHCGRTNQVEEPMHQSEGSEVCVFHSDVPQKLTVPSDRTSQEILLYATFARDRATAMMEMVSLTVVNPEQHHLTQMEADWSQYGITVEGNDELDRAIKASTFQLFSNIAPRQSHYILIRYMYGLSSSGIGGDDFHGHIFYDNDLWIIPTILLFNPEEARRLLFYRTRTFNTVLSQNAVEQGHSGWRFPRASGFTGIELSQSDTEARLEHHTTADVAFALRQYLYATDDLSWFQINVCRIAYQTALFWKNRVHYNSNSDKYDIRHVTGPDTTHSNVTNNAFTNMVAAHNLFLGEFAGCMCQSSLGLRNEEWKELVLVAKSISMPYDAVNDYHPQFEGYSRGSPVGQADAVMLNFPLGMDMDSTTKHNDLDFYSRSVGVNSRATTWPMYTIGWLDLDEPDRAAAEFQRTYQRFMNPPFYVWQEWSSPGSGASNFITGASGLLQTILNGYAGVRLADGKMTLKPRLPPGTTQLFIPEIHYMGLKFTLSIHGTGFNVMFTVTPDAPTSSLKIIIDGSESQPCTCMHAGREMIVIEYTRQQSVPNDCKLQPTTVNMRLADQGAATSILASPMVFLALLPAALFSRLF
ncbi:protein-glucosylgalactosylhydroxylysine glucosidase-like [Uranotaenia lowii]|uniref:protein-glucosylgalactosylhydroxylysine glucosidase-like n=1 Tax=Uranotaenia lowii TaxID=190385 RepID=UPI002478B183|nr:protein-glucosylgalactosylhydroxylysine glucosidase-like [Uranotaenia lowii]